MKTGTEKAEYFVKELRDYGWETRYRLKLDDDIVVYAARGEQELGVTWTNDKFIYGVTSSWFQDSPEGDIRPMRNMSEALRLAGVYPADSLDQDDEPAKPFGEAMPFETLYRNDNGVWVLQGLNGKIYTAKEVS